MRGLDIDVDRIIMMPTMDASTNNVGSQSRGRRAWVTLLTNPQYVPAILTMWRTLQPLTIYPLVVLVTPELGQNSLDILARYGLETIQVDRMEPPSHIGFSEKFARFSETWTKLRAFGLQGFEKIVMVDSDVLFLRNMDEIFDFDLQEGWIGAAPACVCNPFKIPTYPKDWIPENCKIAKQSRFSTPHDLPPPEYDAPWREHQLNSGFVLLSPSEQHMTNLEKFIAESPLVPKLTFPDQETLCHMYRGKWQPLPWWCNALKTERAVHKEQWADDEVRMIHYILDKPWAARPALLDQTPPPSATSTASSVPSSASSSTGIRSWPESPAELVSFFPNTPAQRGVKEYDEVHSWWWLAYEDVLRDMQAEGEESGWQEVDRHVTR